tara:strand:- start:372 stop:914 length:543 start_codon:yes stop_codon:yes gene_type:complete
MAITNNYLSYDPLITASEVISLVFTNQNTDPTLISTNLIQMAEFAHLKSAIGDDFYLHLKKVFNSPPVGAPSVEDTDFLAQWLKPCFAWFVRFEVINEIQDNSTSSGIVSAIPDFSKVVTPKELNVYKQDTYRRGNVMFQGMIDFLDKNSSDFPEYQSSNSVDCGNTNNHVSKQHGMIIY